MTSSELKKDNTYYGEYPIGNGFAGVVFTYKQSLNTANDIQYSYALYSDGTLFGNSDFSSDNFTFRDATVVEMNMLSVAIESKDHPRPNVFIPIEGESNFEKHYAIVRINYQGTEDKWATEHKVVEMNPRDRWEDILAQLKKFNYQGDIVIAKNC